MIAGTILTPPRRYPYPVHLFADDVFQIVHLLEHAFGPAESWWPTMN